MLHGLCTVTVERKKNIFLKKEGKAVKTHNILVCGILPALHLFKKKKNYSPIGHDIYLFYYKQHLILVLPGTMFDYIFLDTKTNLSGL